MTLRVAEAYELLESLQYWAEEVAVGTRDPGWHTHVSDTEGIELTIWIDSDERELPARQSRPATSP